MTEQTIAPATKAVRTRELNQAADTSNYALLLQCLRDAQAASDKAKSMAASGVHHRTWRGNSGSYAVSRRAVARAYSAKETALAKAAQLLADLDLTWGWGEDTQACALPVDYRPSRRPTQVLYIDLPAGQVSFHAPTRGLGPDYQGEWDGFVGRNAARIDAAIDTLVGLDTSAFDAFEDALRAVRAAEVEAQEQARLRRIAELRVLERTSPLDVLRRLAGSPKHQARLIAAIGAGTPLDEAVHAHGAPVQVRRYDALCDGQTPWWRPSSATVI